jgi:hypothetical protein
MDSPTPAKSVITVSALMELHDAASEDRHTQGAPVYNAISAKSRVALHAGLNSLFESHSTEISRLQREVSNRNMRAMEGDKATKQFNSMYDEIEQLRESLSKLLKTICDPECGGKIDRDLAIKDARIALKSPVLVDGGSV